MTHSPELGELSAALCAAQAEFSAIPKGSTNPFFKSKYAALPVVVEKASPILTSHGLSVAQFIGHDDGEDTLTTWLLHTSGQFIAQAMRLHLVKDDPQAQGSAVTYARRYSYMSVLGLVADDDDDGNGATSARAASPPSRKSDPTKPIGKAKAEKFLKHAEGLGVPAEAFVARLTLKDVAELPDAVAELTKAQADALLADYPALPPNAAPTGG